MKKKVKSWSISFLIFLLLFSISLSYTYITPSLIKVAKIISSENSQYFLDFTNDPALKVLGSIITGKSVVASEDINTTSGRICIGNDCISSWNSLSGIPSGYCVLFYNATCPSGFEVKENLTGKADFSYVIPITIIDTSGTVLTDYQVNITIDTQSLISQGKLRSDCGDIRFYTENDESIPYWIEDGTCNTPNTNIWIKVPEIPANGQTTVYMYYGNPSATSQSNITETFIFGDDFNDGVWVDKWNLYQSLGSEDIIENSGYVNIDDDANNNDGGIIHTGLNIQNYIIETKVMMTYQSIHIRTGNYTSGTSWDNLIQFTGDRDANGNDHFAVGSDFSDYIPGKLPLNQWHKITIKVSETDGKVILYRDYYGTTQYAYSYTDIHNAIEIGIQNWGDGSGKWDWIIVRKYASSEPSVSIGSERDSEPEYKIICCKQ